MAKIDKPSSELGSVIKNFMETDPELQGLYTLEAETGKVMEIEETLFRRAVADICESVEDTEIVVGTALAQACLAQRKEVYDAMAY